MITIEESANELTTIIDPTDRAMTHLVTVLGFDASSAKWALTRSETGHGLDIERAMELLVNGSRSEYSNDSSNNSHNSLHRTNSGSRSSSRQSANTTATTSTSHTNTNNNNINIHTPNSPIEVESSTARPTYIRKKTPVRILQQRDSIATTDEMTEKEKERANIVRMREKSYRVLGIGAALGGQGHTGSSSQGHMHGHGNGHGHGHGNASSGSGQSQVQGQAGGKKHPVPGSGGGAAAAVSRRFSRR